MTPRRRIKVLACTLAATATAALGFTASAGAELVGPFTRFAFCPYKTSGVYRCVNAVTESGEVVLGSKTVPIVNPVTLQGGYSEEAESGEEASFSKFFAATNGITLSNAAQPVPGGLLGLVPPESSPPLVKAVVELAAKNGLTKVDSTLELARPASEIRVSEAHLAEGLGVDLILPLRAHLENPTLGSSCYVGSSSSPIIWKLRADTTEPPEPNKPITGYPGDTEFLEEGRIIELTKVVLVDNSWSAPAASGCGGLLSTLMDPVINSIAGLPAAAGHNTAILNNTISEASAFAVNKNDENHP